MIAVSTILLAAALAASPAPSATPVPVPSLEYQAGVAHESLSHGYPSWDSRYLRVTQQNAPREIFYGQFETASRFDRQDDVVTLGAYLPLGPQWEFNIEGSASGTHNILPASSVTAGLQYASGGNSFEGLAVRTTQYNAASVNSGIVSVEHYWKQYRLYYALTAAHLAAIGTDVEQSAEIDRYYGKGEESFVGIGYLTGREIDNTGLPVLLVSHVEGWSIAGRHWLDTHWAIVYSVGSVAQGSLYTRTGGRVGIDYRF
jgi:YaiO family outer membrane protein